MNEINIDTEKSSITTDNIFAKIWTSPKEVFNFITLHSYDKYVISLLLLSGISRTFDRATVKNMGDTFPLWGVVLFCIIVGGLFGWITYYIYAALISWTGRWFNGKGNTQSILRVLSYAMLPSIIAIILLIPQVAIYGNAIFQSEGDVISAGVFGNILFYSSLVVEFSLSVWTIVLCVIGISVVQQISILKAIMNLLLPAILLVLFVLILYVTIDLFTS